MTIDVRKGMPDSQIGKETFSTRFFGAFHDPAFDELKPELEHAMEVAWDAYARKAPRTQAAGPEFADPGYDMSVEWLAAREAINTAEKAHTDPSLPTRSPIVTPPSPCGRPWARYRAGDRAPRSTLRDPRPK